MDPRKQFMICKIVDSNALRSSALTSFLAQREDNVAVITDHCGIELYKESPERTVPESMAILSRFPRQVLILKTSRSICTLHGKTKGLRNRLVDHRQTKEFPRYCRQYNEEKSVSPDLLRHIVENGKVASTIIQEIDAGIPQWIEEIANVSAAYTASERAAVRNGTPSLEVIISLVNTAASTARNLFDKIPGANSRTGGEELLNRYVFRYSLASQLLVDGPRTAVRKIPKPRR